MIDIPDMIDITGPGVVEVTVREDGSVLWINVDGICRLRICQIQQRLIIDDQRGRDRPLTSSH
jgi:hypothetical protein